VTAIAAIRALLQGEKRDLLEIELDMSGTPAFHCDVYHLTRTIAPGRVMTYGEVAFALGDKSAARAVGQALGANPFPIVVPCHRVVAAGGAMHGFSAPGGVVTKRRLLEIEGALAIQRDLFD
jgi:methylated-DNA-[protein]-cysteine S-methyltransferase